MDTTQLRRDIASACASDVERVRERVALQEEALRQLWSSARTAPAAPARCTPLARMAAAVLITTAALWVAVAWPLFYGAEPAPS